MKNLFPEEITRIKLYVTIAVNQMPKIFSNKMFAEALIRCAPVDLHFKEKITNRQAGVWLRHFFAIKSRRFRDGVYYKLMK